MSFALMEKQNVVEAVKDITASDELDTMNQMRDGGLFVLRLVMGGLMAGHGAQKLFGSFGGPGLEGTAGWLESMGLKPGKPWAFAAALSEFGGGVLSTLGLFHPLGPLAATGGMIMATVKGHWGKPIWATQGGGELAVTDLAIALALALTGDGRFSLDHLLGIRLPRGLVIAITVAEAVMLAAGIMSQPEPAPAEEITTGPPAEAEQEAEHVRS